MLTLTTAYPEETGVPSGCILSFIRKLQKQELPMHSLLILRHDRLITEGYYSPCKKDSLHRMFSVSKSFTAIAIGLLMDEGKLSLEDRIVRFFPDKVPADVHPWIAEMTIRDMLMMRTCHASTTYKLDLTKDWVESFFTTAPTHPAGRIFHYDTSSAHTLCALCERLSGMPMLDYIKAKLPELNLSEESYMLKDPSGVSIGGSGLVATSMDLMKFGYFLLHGGKLEGRQALSPSYLQEALSPLTATCVTAPVLSEAMGYGYQIWQNQKGGFVCYGMGGQLIICLPKEDMIVVTTADTQGIGGGNQLIYDALYEEILPCLSDSPLTVTKASAALYDKTVQELSLAPLKGTLYSPLMELSGIAGRDYQASPNPAGFSGLSLSFSLEEPLEKAAAKKADCQRTVGTLHFTLKEKDYAFSFGFGFLKTGLFPVYDLYYAASGVWLDEQTLYIKVHIIDAYVGSLKFQLSLGKDAVLFMKKQEESLFQEFNGHLYFTS
jgi:CubicO group peptidase (beta-lactamase class C family)